MAEIRADAGTDALRTLPPGQSLRLAVTAGCLAVPIAALVIGVSIAQVTNGIPPAVWTDFNVFWAAATLALGGDGLAALDVRTLYDAMPVQPDAWYPFAYPPGFLALITPLGLAPFAVAWPLFSGLSVLALAAALRVWCAGLPAILIAAALAPVILPAVILGQTSLIWTAALLAALWRLRCGDQVMAGILIGCLTLKPQLGLMLPVALAAGGAWLAILWALITAGLLAIGPLILFGFDYLPLLFEGVSGHLAATSGAERLPGRMLAVLTFLIGAGVPKDVAMVGQAICAAGVGGLVLIVWRSRTVDPDVRDAVLLAAIPLSTPYFWHYELVIPAAALLFLLRARAHPAGMIGAGLFLSLWFGGAAIVLFELMAPTDTVPARYLFLPLLVALFAQTAKCAVAKMTRL
ncbi:MAG: glycosyltransferase family 87 protein [Pseudomonadota bacterium]